MLGKMVTEGASIVGLSFGRRGDLAAFKQLQSCFKAYIGIKWGRGVHGLIPLRYKKQKAWNQIISSTRIQVQAWGVP